MKKQVKENILCAIAVALFCATLVVTIFLSVYLMRAGGEAGNVGGRWMDDILENNRRREEEKR